VGRAAFASSGAALAAGACYLGYKWITAEKSRVEVVPQIVSKVSPASSVPENPHAKKIRELRGKPQDQIVDIYRPPRFEGNLAPYAAKIEKLKEDPRVMGLAFVQSKEKELVPVYIQRTSPDIHSPLECFSAHDLQDDSMVGKATVIRCVDSNEFFRRTIKAGYGSDLKEVNKIYIELIENYERSGYFSNRILKNVGVVLIQSIIQQFSASCEGRIVLDAINDTPAFYYKLGFRFSDPKMGFVSLRLNQDPTIVEAYHPMYLADQARQLWLTEIKINPIRFP
jgi:hypothetical protein